MSVPFVTKVNNAGPTKNTPPPKKRSGYKAVKGAFEKVHVGLTVLKESHVLPPTSFPFFFAGVVASVLSVPSYLDQLAKNVRKTGLKGSEYVKRNLKIAFAVTGLACTALYCVKLFDTIGVAAAAAVSQSMGTLRVATSALAPFTVALAGLEIVHKAVGIGIDAVRIHQTNKKIKQLKVKTKLWGSIEWKDPGALSTVEDKATHLKAKQVTSMEALSALHGATKTSQVALDRYKAIWQEKDQKRAVNKLSLSKRNVIIRLFGEIVPRIKAHVAKSKYKVALKEHTGNINDFKHLSEKYYKRTVKITHWKVVESKMRAGTLTENDLALLQKFQTDQVTKWGVKKANYNLKKLKLGLGIALKTVAIIALIASIVLAFTGYGTIPGIVTIVTLTLFLAAAEFGLNKFKQYKKPALWTPGQVPLLT